MKRVRAILLFGSLGVLAVTFFTGNSFRTVTQVNDAVCGQPVQGPPTSGPISFQYKSFRYDLEPLYDYHLNGLVMSALNYDWIASGPEKVFPVDLCLMWGTNAQRKLHLDRDLSVTQDCRWFWVRWKRDIGFNMKEISNNHLIVKEESLRRRLKSIRRGDQVSIKGKLVRARITNTAQPGRPIDWKSSTTREDSGAGACEVIFVEQLELLKKANELSRVLFHAAAVVFVMTLCWAVGDFLMAMMR